YSVVVRRLRSGSRKPDVELDLPGVGVRNARDLIAGGRHGFGCDAGAGGARSGKQGQHRKAKPFHHASHRLTFSGFFAGLGFAGFGGFGGLACLTGLGFLGLGAGLALGGRFAVFCVSSRGWMRLSSGGRWKPPISSSSASAIASTSKSEPSGPM